MSVQLASIDQTTLDIRKDVQSFQKQRRADKITLWLGAPDPSFTLDEASKEWHQGTNTWFTEGRSFSRWKQQPGSCLWLHGPPGCGKTVLSSSIIHNLEYDNALFFFFDSRGPDVPGIHQMLTSLVSQLHIQHRDTGQHLDVLWQECGNGTRKPTLIALKRVFEAMIIRIGGVKVVIDALDESNEREKVLEWLKTCPQDLNMQVIVTSRREVDIESILSKLATVIEIQKAVVDQDVLLYVRHQMQEGNALQRWCAQPKVRAEIESAFMERSGRT